MNSFIISGNSITYHSYNDNLISKAIDMDCDIIYNKYSTTVVFPTIQALQYFFVSDIVMNNETLELPSNTLTTDAEFYDQLSNLVKLTLIIYLMMQKRKKTQMYETIIIC